MKQFIICMFICLLAGPVLADSDADRDPTPVPMCSALPNSAVISALSSEDAKRIVEQ